MIIIVLDNLKMGGDSVRRGEKPETLGSWKKKGGEQRYQRIKVGGIPLSHSPFSCLMGGITASCDLGFASARHYNSINFDDWFLSIRYLLFQSWAVLGGHALIMGAMDMEISISRSIGTLDYG